MGDSKTNPPKNGDYKNVLLYYEADQTSWLYSSDGIPTRLTNGLTDYEAAINLPQINGVTLLGNKSLGDLGITDAIDDAVAAEKAEREAFDDDLQNQVDDLIDTKQDKLTAGNNITITGNTISATVPTVPTKTSDLTNDGATGTSVYIEESDITPSELSGEGEFITLDGTTDCSALDIQLNGNAMQQTYSGKNLFSGDFSQFDNQGGTGSTYSYFKLPTNGRYTLSLKAKNNVSAQSVQVFLGFSFKGGESGGGLIWAWTNGSSASAGDIRSVQNESNGVTLEYVSMYVNNAATLQWFVNNFEIQLEAGSSATSYEPFVGGTPAPNPDYPQPISVVTGENVVKVVGKNLWGLTPFRTGNTFYNLPVGTQITAGTSSAVTLEQTDDGFNVSATTGWNGAWFLIPVKSGESYRLHYTQAGENARSSYYTLDSSLTILSSSPIGTPYTVDRTITVPSNGTYIAVTAGIQAAGTTGSWTQPQLELGSTATAYKPYQGQEFEVNLGKNLFDLDTAVTRFENADGVVQSGGATYSDGVVRMTWTLGAEGRRLMAGFKPALVEGRTYTLSADVYLTGTNAANSVAFGSISSWAQVTLIGKDAWYRISKTFTATSADVADSRMLIEPANSGNSLQYKNVQLELGQPTSYASYFTPLELAGVGEIQPDGLPKYHDQIKKNLTTGKWYIRRNIGKKVCDGSENWIKSSSYQGNYYLVGALGTNAVATGRDYMANLTKIFVINGGELASSDNCIFVEAGGAQGRNLDFKVSSKATLQDFKDFLSATPLVFYYPLSEPVDEEITNQTLIDQLEALAGAHGYDGVTNIMSTSPGLPAILSVSTYTDSVIPSATRTRAGIVRVGNGIDIDGCGTISVKQPTAFTMQYAEGLGDWQSGDNYELVKKTTGSPAEYIYRADKHYTSGTGVSFLNEKTGVALSPQELYALLLTGEEVVLNHVPLGWAVDNGGEAQSAGNYIDGIRLKRETITSLYGNVVSFNGSAFVTTYIPRSSSYEETVQDTLGIAISGYEDDGAMVYDLVSIDGFSLYGSLQ